jgi:hypothetical protein
MTRTPILHTRQNWHNHLTDKTIVREVISFRIDSSIKCRISLHTHIFFVTRHDVTHHAAFQSGVFSWWTDSSHRFRDQKRPWRCRYKLPPRPADVFCAAPVGLHFLWLSSSCTIKRVAWYQKTRFVKAVTVWQYLQLWSTVHVNEEHQIKNCDACYWTKHLEERMRIVTAEIKLYAEELITQKSCQASHYRPVLLKRTTE